MDTKERLTSDMKTAMKAKDQLTLSTIRMVRAAIKNAEIDKKHEMSEEETLRIVAKELKKRRESIAHYERGGREDLVEKEGREAAVLEGYLPSRLDEKEVSGLIDEALMETGAGDIKDMGKVMAYLKPKISGRADGGAVSRAVRERLS